MNRTSVWIVVLPALLFAVGCNCCNRKGIVLRGDWSLELNRVPHMKSNGAQYGDCEACDYGCVESIPNGCVGECSGGCLSGRRNAGGAPLNGGEYYEGYSGEMHAPEPPLPTPATQTRFHPVPTRPVFEPEYVPGYPEMIQPASASNDGWKSKRRA